jgi:hypothetical protein
MSGECNVCGRTGCVEGNHRPTALHLHCDMDPIECSHEALVGEYEERGRRIADLERQVRILDDHLAAAQYGCPDCGVHHGCIEMAAENERLKGELADASHRAVTATEEARVAKGVLAKLKPSARGVWSPSADEHLPYVLLGLRDVDLTDAEAALFDTITEETP